MLTGITVGPSEVVLLALVEWYFPPAHPQWYSAGKQQHEGRGTTMASTSPRETPQTGQVPTHN